MERVLRQKIALAPNARMKQLIHISQGQIERILEEDLKANAPNALLRGFQITDVQMDENPGHHRQWLGKTSLFDTMQISCWGGWSSFHDHVWGVIDFVTDTEFPDIRRLTTVQNRFGMAMGIPREKNAQGEWRTRFYADMNDLEVKRRQVVHDIHDTNETVLVENRSRLTTFTSA
ncbi:aminotransferase class 3 [Venturia nashicola]|uniref:Aminotransferase class 3 n=1 Tax=Venturia nashicola TaxID=86259 RepID=A0A4Z1PFW4_9PEZI|nr:aminotransferase class 3 [Venturia nashicola]